MKRLAPAVLVTVTTACFPSFDDRPWLVDGTRILAVKSEPAEARPMEPVTYQALLAAPGDAAQPVVFAYCLSPRRLEERAGVAPVCLDDGDHIAPIGGDAGIVPMDACARFGPNPPPSEPGEPPLRPADPDPTGGYYQPVRVRAGEVTGFGFQRLRCDLGRAPLEIHRAFERSYENNDNPTIEAVEIVDRQADTVEAGASVPFRVAWTPESAEPYPQFDPVAVELVDRVETMSVHWFTTAGDFDAHRSFAGEDDPPFVENLWTAPDEPGEVTLWFVLRDARGGVAWRSVQVSVE